MKRLIVASVLVVYWFIASGEYERIFGSPGVGSPDHTAQGSTFGRAQSGNQVMGTGTVVKVLPDDNDGSRHQRFILGLASGQTLLVAHNIDLAPRVVSIRKGDAVNFYGVYEWNSQGGVVHWTHDDPNGRHIAGWLKVNGRVYQ